MKIDLTLREIELILMLVNDSAGDDARRAPIFSIEELALIEKLEMAVKKEELMEKMLLDVNLSNLQH